MARAERSASGGAVFLSYASQDAAAAQRLCDALRAAGVEVWFDRNELTGGDLWDAKIRKQIADCALFVPVISAATQARLEGYFRIEWKLAASRTHAMADEKAFLLPVVIDDTRDAEAKVPAEFKAVQWTRLPNGEAAEKFCARVKALLEGEGRDGSPSRPSSDSPASPGSLGETSLPSKVGRSVPAAALSIVVLAIVFAAGGYFWATRAPEPAPNAGAGTRPPTAEKTAAATRDFPRDAELKRAWQLIYTLNSVAEDYALADDIVKPVLAARPNDPEVTVVAAAVVQETLTRGFDLSEARRAQVQRLAERAVQLAPENPDALAVLGRYLVYINAQPARAEELLRRAIALHSGEARYHRALYQVLAYNKPAAEAAEFGARMAAEFPTDPLVPYDIARTHKDADNLALMEEWIDRSLAIRPLTFALVWKAWLRLDVHGDVAGMKAALDRVPERERLTTRVVNAFAVHAGLSGQTETAQKLARAVADPWLTDFDFTGPKALLLGDLLQIEGRTDLARLQYEAALADIRRAVARDPTDLRPRRAEMWTQLGLGHRDEARAALQLVAQALPRPYRFGMNNSWESNPMRAALLLGERDLAIALLKEACALPAGRLRLRNLIRVDPRMTPFRDDPEIVALLAEPAGGAEKKTAAAPQPPSEAAQLAARALTLFTKTGFTRDDLVVAEDFAKRATDKEPDSAAAWGVRAGVQSAWLFRNWDQGEKRRQDTQSLANKALALNPNEPEALLALSHVLRAQRAFDQAADHLRRALAANPNHVRLARSLGFTLLVARKTDEARAVLREVAQRVPRDPLVRYDLAMAYTDYDGRGADPANLAGALENLDAAIAIQSFGSAVLLKATLLGGWRGDLPAMRATLDQLDALPLGERSDDRAVCLAMWAGLIERRPERVEAAAALTARNYFEDAVMPLRPKAWSLALAHRVAGKDALARRDWQAAETVLRQRLKDDPANETSQVELAVTLAWLGQAEEAARLIAVVEPVWREESRVGRAPLLARYYGAAGDAARATEWLGHALDRAVFMSRKVVPLDPWWDKVRDAPEFQAALKAPAAK